MRFPFLHVSWILTFSFILSFFNFWIFTYSSFIVQGCSGGEEESPIDEKANGFLGSEYNFLFIFMKIATQSEKNREKIKNTNTTSLILLMRSFRCFQFSYFMYFLAIFHSGWVEFQGIWKTDKEKFEYVWMSSRLKLTPSINRFHLRIHSELGP